MRRSSNNGWITGGLFVLAGCSAGPTIGSNTRPEDQSAGGHRAEATQHQQEAAREHERESSSASALDPTGTANSDTDDGAQQREAQQHLQDATALENVMNTQCAQVPAPERARCTVAERHAAAVEDVPGGVRIRFAPGGDAASATAQRARCTHAYADYAGRETMPACVLAVRDLTIDARDEAGAVVLTVRTADAASVDELRRRARADNATATAAGGGPASQPAHGAASHPATRRH